MHIAAIPQAAGGNLGRVGRHRTFWGSVEGGANAVSINFGWMPVWASIDKGAAAAAEGRHRRRFFETLPLIDMTDRAGSPSWDWRNFLERSPDDPWWDKQGYLTADAQRSVAALHVSSWFDMAERGARGARDLPEERAERARARRAVRDHLAHHALRVGARRRAQTEVGALDGRRRAAPLLGDVSRLVRPLAQRQRARDRFAAARPVLHDRPQRVAARRTAGRCSGMRETAFYLRQRRRARTRPRATAG